jgi:amidohydrolase
MESSACRRRRTQQGPPIGPALEREVRGWFAWLHRHPELSFHERETAAFVAARLRDLGYTPTQEVGAGPHGERRHGVVAALGADRSAPALAFRAELDALPLAEASGLPYASERPGVMHACGHDAHTAMLLGAAAALADRDRARPLAAPVVFVFQPAEEVPPGGARGLVDAGVLDAPPVGAVFGLHQYPYGDAGTFEITTGPACAAADDFDVTIRGRGGHAGWPQQAIDPVLVAAHVVVALQGIVSRQVDPRRAAVLTVGVVEAGSQRNVIPDAATLRGTARTLDAGVRDQLPARLRAVVEGVCAAFGAAATLDYRPGYDAVVNDPAMAALATAAAADVVGPERVRTGEPVMDSEDFGAYLRRAPGCLAWMGSGAPAVPPEERPGVHTPRFALDPACLGVGVAWYVAVAERYCARLSAAPGT